MLLLVLAGGTFASNFSGGVVVGASLLGLALLCSWASEKYNKKEEAGHENGKEERTETVLDKKDFRPFTISEVIVRSHDVKQFRVQLPAGHSLGIPVGTHVSVQVQVGDELRSKPYTPISSTSALGYFDLLIKCYPEGRVSKALHELKVGDKVGVRGPVGRFRHSKPAKEGVRREYGMIAGGSGVTPMLQVIHAITEDEEDDTKVSFLYSNKQQRDILLRSELDLLAKAYGSQITIEHVLTREPEDSSWKGARGRIGPEMIRKALPAPVAEGEEDREVMIFLCGPAAFNKAMREHLTALGYPKGAIHKF